jgi:membrane fusion protein, multidrug efflux system
MAQGSLQVEASPAGDDGPPSIGHITFVDNTVDQTTGSIKIKATFPNAGRQLWPGQFVNIVVRLATDRSAIVVPTSAVQMGPQGQYVYLVKPDKTVAVQPVEIARTAGNETVIKSGVNGGDVVVTDGQLRLVPGSHISIKTTAAPKVES